MSPRCPYRAYQGAGSPHALDRLRAHGSLAVPGFLRPEGVVVYHIAANMGFKVTLEKDEERKGGPR